MTRRTRNRRGEGERLRAEIVAAAAALLEDTGDEGAVTLRAVARRVGITAPSIYAHFDGREAILKAVVAKTFTVLMDRLRAATDAADDPVDRLHAGCRAYVAFAAEQPQRYRVLFQLRTLPEGSTPPETVEDMLGADAFGLLVESVRACAAAGRSASVSPEASALQLWIGLHGYATLRPGTPGFPWPDGDALLRALIDRLAEVDRQA